MIRDNWGYFYTSQIFEHLKAVAERRDIVWYSDVADDAGGNRLSLGGRELSAIWRICQDRAWPHLNALVVRVINGLPGEGYTPNGSPVTADEFRTIKQEIYDFDWTDKHL